MSLAHLQYPAPFKVAFICTIICWIMLLSVEENTLINLVPVPSAMPDTHFIVWNGGMRNMLIWITVYSVVGLSE